MSLSVAHFSTLLAGGSGIAAQRLHRGLLGLGADSHLVYGDGSTSDPTCRGAYQNQSFVRRNLAAIRTSIQNRKTSEGGFVTGPGWIRPTPLHDTGLQPDIVNLHWVARWLDLPSFFHSLPQNQPVVWSIHDLIPITGGCHYPKECDHFSKECGNCPQQKSPHPRDDTHKNFRIKKRLYEGSNLHFVGNSTWTTEQIHRSALGKCAKSITTIPLGLDPLQYAVIHKSVARQALQIPEGKFVIGFACSDFHEKRKGADLLLKALESLPSDNILLLIFGSGKWPQNAGCYQTISMGSIGSPRFQSLYYSALDVFVMPSLVETFGLVALEAMACGTPVAAYTAGGLADVVEDGVDGLMEREVGSVSGLLRMLTWMMEHPSEREAMGRMARKSVEEKFSSALMASRYLDLYQSLKNPSL
jgi:glycosyltransferase involved in cell wall biosynthesis